MSQIMKKTDKKKLKVIIKKLVKKEVNKKMKQQKNDIISEVVALLDEKNFRPQNSQNSGQGSNSYETDDPVLKRVLEKNSNKEVSDGFVEQIYQESKSRDPDVIQENIRKAKQQVSGGGSGGKNPAQAIPQQGRQQMAGMQQPQQQQPQMNQQQMNPQQMNQQPQQQPQHQHQQQQAMNQGQNPAGNNPNQLKNAFKSMQEQNLKQNMEKPGQDVVDSEVDPTSGVETQSPQQATSGGGQPVSPQSNERIKPVNHNDPNVPDYLQNAAERDYSDLVNRFDEENKGPV